MRRALYLALAALCLWLGGCSSFIRQSGSEFMSKDNDLLSTEK